MTSGPTKISRRNPATQAAIDAALADAAETARDFEALRGSQRDSAREGAMQRLRRLLRTMVENKATATETERWKSAFRVVQRSDQLRSSAGLVRPAKLVKRAKVSRAPQPQHRPTTRAGPPRYTPTHGALGSEYKSAPGGHVDPTQLATTRHAGRCSKCGHAVYGDTGVCSNSDCITNDWEGA